MIFRKRIQNLDYAKIATVETSLKNFSDTFIKAICIITDPKEKLTLLNKLKTDILNDLQTNSDYPDDIKFEYCDEAYYDYCLSSSTDYKIQSMPVEIHTNDLDCNIIRAIENWMRKT